MVTGANGESSDDRRRRVMKAFAPELGIATTLHQQGEGSDVKEAVVKLVCSSLEDVI